jgi:RNA polymerase sigma-70 factor (ECF subfamily)
MEVLTGTANDPISGVVARAVEGDEEAFEAIVSGFHLEMTRVAYLVSGDADLAQEAVASAWPIAWRKLGSLHEPNRLRSWLMSIAANEARQLLRKRRRRSLREIQLDVVAEQEDPTGNPRDVDLANALGRLSPDDRSLLALRYIAGLNASELARTTGRSSSGTRVRLSRLLARLRHELGDD